MPNVSSVVSVRMSVPSKDLPAEVQSLLAAHRSATVELSGSGEAIVSAVANIAKSCPVVSARITLRGDAPAGDAT